MSVPRLPQGEKEHLQFDELRLPVGERVKLEVRSPSLRCSVIYMGHFPGRTLLLSAPANAAKLPVSMEGRAATVRLITSNRACAFSTRIQKIQLQPFPTIYLEYPERVEAVLVRKAPRIRTRSLVSLNELEEGALGGGWPRQALCTDMSLHGARIEASDVLGNVGDQLLMTLRMHVGELAHVILARCIIRNIEDVDDLLSGDYPVIHGVEFVDLDEETQLSLTGFVYQQMLKELGSL